MKQLRKLIIYNEQSSRKYLQTRSTETTIGTVSLYVHNLQVNLQFFTVTRIVWNQSSFHTGKQDGNKF